METSKELREKTKKFLTDYVEEINDDYLLYTLKKEFRIYIYFKIYTAEILKITVYINDVEYLEENISSKNRIKSKKRIFECDVKSESRAIYLMSQLRNLIIKINS